MTNSGAPPAVRPLPTNPGSERRIGDAIPFTPALGNSNKLNPLRLLGIASFSAISTDVSPRRAAASVTNTSAAPARPRVVAFTVDGTTRASVWGIGLRAAAAASPRTPPARLARAKPSTILPPSVSVLSSRSIIAARVKTGAMVELSTPALPPQPGHSPNGSA